MVAHTFKPARSPPNPKTTYLILPCATSVDGGFLEDQQGLGFSHSDSLVSILKIFTESYHPNIGNG